MSTWTAVKLIVLATLISAGAVAVIVAIIVSISPKLRSWQGRSECENFISLEYLHLIPISEGILVAWAPISSSESCEVIYSVELENNFDETNNFAINTTDDYFIFEVAPLPCTITTIKVTPIANSEIVGNQMIQEYTAGFGNVENMHIDQNDGQLYITWEPPPFSASCNQLRYDIIYRDADEIIEYSYDVEVLTKSFELRSFACTNISVEITPKNKLIFGEVTEQTHIVKMGKVENLAIGEIDQEVVATWNPPPSSTFCNEMKYDVIYRKLGEIVESLEGVEDLRVTFELHSPACTDISIEIIPRSELITGETKEQIYVVRFGNVENIHIDQNDGQLYVTWDPPLSSASCNQLRYDLIYRDGDEIIEYSYDVEVLTKSFELRSFACTNISVEITPKNELIFGEVTEQTHIVKMGKVENLAIGEIDQEVVTTWNPPSLSTFCNEMKYDVIYRKLGEIVESLEGVEDLRVTFELHSPACTDISIEIIPRSELIIGETTEQIYIVQIRKVENLNVSQDEEQLLVTWEPPLLAETCNQIRYDVIYDEAGELVSRLEGVDELNVILELHSPACTNLSVQVIPRNELTSGQVAEKIHTVKIGKVENLDIGQEDEKLIVIWSPPPSIIACKQILYDVVYIARGEVIDSLDDVEELSATFALQSLACTAISIEITPRNEVMAGQMTEETYTVQMGKVEHLLIGQDNEELHVTWDPPLLSTTCNQISYDVVYTAAGEIVNKFDGVEELGVSFELQSISCTNISIEITPRNALTTGPKTLESYTVQMGEVENLIIAEDHKQLIITWNPPALASACNQILYDVAYIEADTVLENIDDVEDLSVTIELQSLPCMTINIEVIARNDLTVGQKTEATYAVEIGEVVNVNIDQKDEQLIIVWDPPLETTACEQMVYDVVYSAADLAVDRRDGVEDLAVTFELQSLACTALNVEITPRNGLITGQRAEETYIVKIPKVESVIINEEEEQLIVTWNPPTTACNQIVYDVIYSAGGVPIDKFEDVEKLSVNFELQSPACTTISMEITPRNELTTGLMTEELHVVQMGKVENLNIKQVSDQLAVTWSRPFLSTACNQIIYDVVYTEGGAVVEKFDGVEELEATFGLKSLACTTIIVEVTPWNELTTGQEIEESFIVQIPKVENVIINEEDEQLIVTWNAPTTACNQIVYDVIYSAEGLTIDKFEGVEKLSVNFELQSPACTIISMEITPRNELTTGLMTEEVHVVQMGEAENLSIKQVRDQLAVTWNRPLLSTACNQIIYDVVYTEGGAVVEKIDGVEELEVTFVLHSFACTTIIVEVTPWNELTTGQEIQESFIVQIGEVENININQDDSQLVVTWDPPPSSTACNQILYDVVYSESGTVVDRFDGVEELGATFELQSLACLTVTIEITARNAITTGLIAEVNYYVNIGAVENVNIIQEEENLIVTWTPPVLAAACNRIRYDVVYSVAAVVVHELSDVEGLEVTFDVQSSACTPINIAITSKNEDIPGQKIEETYIVQIGAVQNLKIDQEGQELIVTWNPPALTTACDQITYDVVYIVADEVVSSFNDVEDLTVTFELQSIACSDIIVEVTPKSELAAGQVAQEILEVKIGGVQNVNVGREEEQLVVTWEHPMSATSCAQFRYDVIYSAAGEILGSAKGVEELRVAFDVHSPACTDITIEITATSETMDGEVTRQNFAVPMGKAGNLDIEGGGTRLTVSWDPPSGTNYCGSVAYDVICDDGHRVQNFHVVDDTKQVIDLQTTCTEVNVEVIPRSGLIIGEATSTDYTC